MSAEANQKIAKFMDWLFYGVLAYSAMSITGNIEKMQNSINELNVKMGIVVEKTSIHEAQLQRQDERIRALEKSGH